MYYPVLVHKEKGSCYSAVVLDLAGCTSQADTMDELIANLQEAFEVWMDGEKELPSPSPLETALEEFGDLGGAVMQVDIDLSFLDTSKQRVNIIIPVHILRRIDRAAKEKGLNRSEFLTEAGLRCA